MAKILVVDDDSSIVEILQFLLIKEGHTVCVARNGKAGLEMAKNEHPDLMILDVMMPEMDGFSVSGELLKDPAGRRIPILILTAKGNMRGIFAMVPNVSAYIDKPFEPDQLLEVVRQTLAAQAKAA